MAECQATKNNGRTCGAHAREGSLYCYFHDPSRAAERQLSRKLGGMNKRSHAGDVSSIPAKVRTVEDVLALLDYLKDELAALDNGIPRGRALIALAGEYIHCFEVGSLEARLERLEEAVNVSKR